MPVTKYYNYEIWVKVKILSTSFNITSHLVSFPMSSQKNKSNQFKFKLNLKFYLVGEKNEFTEAYT